MPPNIFDFDHTCRCQHCAPEAFPRGPRAHSGHLAWRFGDTDRPEWFMATMWVDGQPEWHAVEALPGPEGYVVRAIAFSACPAGQHNPATCCTHLCRACGSDSLCLEVVKGSVHISYDRARVPILTGGSIR